MLGKLVRGFAIGLMLGASTLVGTQASASAAVPASWSWCPDGKMCLASGRDGAGTRWSYGLSEMGGGLQLNSRQRNHISSVWNRTGVGASVHDDPNCVGAYHETPWGTWVNGSLTVWIDGPVNLDFYNYDNFSFTYWDTEVESVSTWGPVWPDHVRCAKRVP